MTSKNPMYPDAHPTAPGGMSQKALIKELVDKHGYEADPEAWAQVSWPELIDMVVAERQEREAEQSVTYAEPVDSTVPMSEAFPDATPETAGIRDTDADAILALPSPEVEDMFDLLDDDDAGDPDQTYEAAVELLDVLMPLIEDIAEEADSACEHPVCDVHGHEPDEFAMGTYDDGVLDPEIMFAEMAAAREEATPPPLFIGLPSVKDYIFDGHAGAGPSGAERWMNCTMSLTASRRFLETLSPNQQVQFAGASTAARQGTTAHAVGEAEANLILGRTTQEEVDYILTELSVMPEDEGEAYDDEMAEYVTEYTDLVKSYAQERGNNHVLIEARVEAAIPLTDMHEGEVYIVRGSADLAVLPAKIGPAENKTLVVGDLKYGNGIDVDVDANPQIREYALGVLELLADPETGELPAWLTDVVYHIIQPRLGGIKTWTESIDDLLTWRDEVLAPALTKALYGEAEGATFEPSELACQFCPARGTCPALTEQRVEAAAGLFDVIVDAEFTDGPGSFPEPVSLTNDRLGELLTMVAGLHDIHKDLKEEAQRRLHRGTSVPGYQLVNYTPPRKWKDGAETRLAKVKALWKEPTMVTPTQAEKILGPEKYPRIAKLVDKPDKRPVIAKEGDRRTTWEGKPPEQMFSAITEED